MNIEKRLSGWGDPAGNVHGSPLRNAGSAHSSVARSLSLVSVRRPSSGAQPVPAAESGSSGESFLRFYISPWMQPASGFRYKTGNRRLMALLEAITAKVWVLGAVDDIGEWLGEGSSLIRIALGGLAACAMSFLLFGQLASMQGLRSFAEDPLFAGHGAIVLILLAAAAGLVLLPSILAALLAILVRVAVVTGLLALAAGAGYGIYLLCLQLKVM
jgi:hypothetical protein